MSDDTETTCFPYGTAEIVTVGLTEGDKCESVPSVVGTENIGVAYRNRAAVVTT